MSNRRSYKYCIVPCCTSSTSSTPGKVFLSVPKDPVKRKAWVNAMKRDDKANKDLSSASTVYCCEDHFLLPEDMENYWQWKLTNDVQKIKLKPHVIPHIFACQRKNPLTLKERPAAKKRKNMHLVQEAISEHDNTQMCSTSSATVISTTSFEIPTTSSEICVISEDGYSRCDKGIQVNLKKTFRSRGTSTIVHVASVGCTTSNFGINVGTSISPEKFQRIPEKDNIESEVSSSDFATEEEVSSECSDAESYEQSQFKRQMLWGTIKSIEIEPRLYLGITKKTFFLVNSLHEETHLPINSIYLVLKKIRLNLPFSILAIDFGLTKSTACRVFAKSLPIIASAMQELIVLPERKVVQANLPICFRARYGNVMQVIDCFEIEIEKPSNAVTQALTWSEYYKCNTIKYLLSCAPDGLVVFISEGFGGRTSDLLIVQNSDFLNRLVQGSDVMADRGFKNISYLLQQKNCRLVRPPSVAEAVPSTNQEVKQSKQVAALRIHIERLIRRVREFKMLSPHACIDRQHISLLDYAVITACGIINMQDRLL